MDDRPFPYHRPGNVQFDGMHRVETLPVCTELLNQGEWSQAEGQIGWSLYRIRYDTERIHESLGYQTPHQRLTSDVSKRCVSLDVR